MTGSGDPRHLFVYGSLRRAHQHPMHRVLARYAEYAGGASLQGRLFKVSWYPGATASDNARDRVAGELYRLRDPDRCLAALDDFEGYAPQRPESEFVRQILPVIDKRGQTIEAWVYLYNRSTLCLARIRGGDFLAAQARLPKKA